MNRLFFILIFLFGWTVTASTPEINKNLKNKSAEFETEFLKSKNHRMVSLELSNALNNKSLALCNNNPGNLRSFKTGEFRVFNTLEEGYAALVYDLNLKITGRSIWTDSTTTISDLINIYAPALENDVNVYLDIFCVETGLQKTNLINTQDVELLARGIIKMENINIYHQIYSTQNN